MLSCLYPDLVVEEWIRDGILEAVSGDGRRVFRQRLQGVQLSHGIALVPQRVLPRGVRLLGAELANPLVVGVHPYPEYRYLVTGNRGIIKNRLNDQLL